MATASPDPTPEAPPWRRADTDRGDGDAPRGGDLLGWFLPPALATVGMLVLPAATILLSELGPTSRVAFRPYLPTDFVVAALQVGAGAILGASLGAEAGCAHGAARACSPNRLATGALLGAFVGLVAAITVVLASPRGAEGSTFASALLFFGLVALGGWSGARLLLRFRESGPRERQLPLVRLVLVGLLVLWLLAPQIGAFPAGDSLARREAWARKHVKEYAGLAEVVAAVPAVLRDVGRVVATAPTSGDRHSFAREMNGDDMRFVLEVAGEAGAGVFRVDCTIMDGRILDWRGGSWSFAGRTTPVPEAPPRFLWKR